LVRLERSAVKVARCVLRGLGEGDLAWLPGGVNHVKWQGIFHRGFVPTTFGNLGRTKSHLEEENFHYKERREKLRGKE
jgi:hypothetical protein